MSGVAGMALEDAMRSQRAIRRLRPDPLDDGLVLELIELALKAPTGGNRQNWEFVLVKDPRVKARLAALNRQGLSVYRRIERNLPSRAAVDWQAQHLHEAPVIVVACLHGVIPPWPPVATASLYASIFPSVQNLLLAARAANVGAALHPAAVEPLPRAPRAGLAVDRGAVRRRTARLADRALRADAAPTRGGSGFRRSLRQSSFSRRARQRRRVAAGLTDAAARLHDPSRVANASSHRTASAREARRGAPGMNALPLPRWMRTALQATCVMNVLAAAAFLPAMSAARSLMGLPGDAHPLYLWVVAEFVFLFGVGYGWCGLAGQAPPLFIALAAAGKASFFATLLGYWLAGEVSLRAVTLASADLVLAALFAVWLAQQRAQPSAASSHYRPARG